MVFLETEPRRGEYANAVPISTITGEGSLPLSGARQRSQREGLTDSSFGQMVVWGDQG